MKNKQLLAFKNCSENKEQAIASARFHVAQDMLVRGTYSPNEAGKMCSIGCHYNGNHSRAPAKHGFDEKFVRLCDRIFESHPTDKAAAEFHVWVMENVAEGADTTLIWWEFFALTMEPVSGEFASECRNDAPDLARLGEIALALDRARARARALALDLDLARQISNFKNAVLSAQNPQL